ncbi:MAG: PQQ-binding-like beta-propeller repeat protein [Planctomycetaceae bacterium]|nr:PQQ-binding-like beta-propeller repeat protein [Planctomycetaceae bacterium]
MRVSLLVTSILALMTSAGLTIAGDWPAFRGPNGDGTADESGLPVEWGPETNIKWTVPLPAPANSSPIVSNGRVSVTCAEERGQKRHLLCFDRTNGEMLWVKTVPFGKVAETHETNPYCGSTPAADGERVVVWHGSAGIHCYDFYGELVWSQQMGEFNHVWGYGSSPIILHDKVIQLCGPGARTKLVAFNLADGEILWETQEPGSTDSEGGRYTSTWSTPVVVNVNGLTQLLVAMPTRVGGYSPETGELLWYVEGLSNDRSDVSYTSPLARDDLGVMLGGFGGPAMGFRLGGSGDMTEQNQLWRQAPTSPYNPQRIGSGIIIGEHVYHANADGPGSIVCFDLKTGEVCWEHKRTKDGPHWGSMVYADGRLYVTGQQGVTTVFAPNPDEFELLAENDLGERSHSTPAMSNGEIFLRTYERLYCIAKD